VGFSFLGSALYGSQTNIIVQILFHLPIMSRIEGLILTLYIYFCKNLKRYDNWILQNFLKSWNPKGVRFFKMSKHGGLICYLC
jgi:hypothetical protein